MRKMNVDLRAEIMRAGLKNHEVGQRMGLTETRFSKLLGNEMSPGDREKVLAAISAIKTERETVNDV